jgi:hypothetical protein
MRVRADGFDAVDDGLDVVLRRRLFHHDHHLDAFLVTP